MTIDRIIWTPLERDTISRIVWTPLLILLACLITSQAVCQNVNDIVLSRRIASTGREEKVFWRAGFTITNGVLTVNAPTVSIAGVTGLQAALDGKAATNHTQAWSTITGTPTTLLGYGITSFSTTAFKLAASTPDTLTGSELGLGWKETKMTLGTPGSAFQFYQSGSPAQAVASFGGTIVCHKIEATALSVMTTVPATSGSPGEVGQMASDGFFLYVCTGFNEWKRVPLSAY